MTQAMTAMTTQMERIQTSQLTQFSKMIQKLQVSTATKLDNETNRTPSYMVNINRNNANQNTFNYNNHLSKSDTGDTRMES